MQSILKNRKAIVSLLAVVAMLVSCVLSPVASAFSLQPTRTAQVLSADESTYEGAVAAATARSVLYEGSANMKAAIASVLADAVAGNAVTLVTLGDSITAGAVAPAGQEWASLVEIYLEGLDGNSANNNVTLVNAGIGSTEGILGVTRIARDVLSKSPDLVIVDFGTNDYHYLPNGYNDEAYEGILTKLISAGVPVINSNVCPNSGNNIQDLQAPINKAYGVPQVSFKTAYYELSKTTTIAGLTMADIWSTDTVHPTTAGHKLLADLLIAYMQTYILDAGVAAGTLSTTLPSKVTNNGFADAIFVENNTNDSRVTVNQGNWTTYNASVYELKTAGWTTSTIGDSISFTFTGGYFYMFYELNSDIGDIEIAVDGTIIGTITWAYQGTGYMNPYHIVHENASAEHTVTITLRDNANVTNDALRICAVGASNFAGYDLPASTTGIVDEVTTTPSGWYGFGAVSYETTGGYEDGAVWVKASATTAEADSVLINTYAPLNMVNYENGYLHLRLYVNDISLLKAYAGMIEITSSKRTDQEELYWPIHDYVTQSGWTELYLPLSAATAQGDKAFDIKNFDCIRIVGMFNAAGGVIGVDDIRFVNEKPVTSVVIGEIESTEGWLSTDGAVPTVHDTDAPVGSYWIESTAANWPVLFSGFSGLDLSAFSNGYLHMWLYVSEAVGGGQIELTSSGAPDSGEIGWNLVDMGLQPGWNELYLPFANGIKTDDTLNLSAINYIRIFAGSMNTITIGIDKMEVVLTKPEAPVADSKVISEVEAIDNWVSDFQLTLKDTDAAVGSNWISTVNTSTGASIAWWPVPAVDISDYSDGYLHMWLYVPSASNVVGGQIELCSGGTADINEISWNLTTLGLQDGWNELYLPFSGANVVNGAVNYSAINFIRIYSLTTTADTIGIDKMEAVLTKPEAPVVEDVVIGEIEAQDTWVSVNDITVMNTDAAVGNVWLKTTNADHWPSIATWPATALDVSAFSENGYLHMWLYVPKAIDVVGGQIELTNNNGDDNQEASWNLVDLNLHDGWNELYLPFASVNKLGTEIDFTQIKFIRIYAGLTNAACIGMDKIELTMTKGTGDVTLDRIASADAVNSWGGASFTYTTADSHYGLNGWLKTPAIAGTSDVVFMRGFQPMDLSSFANGYLHMWVYIDDLDSMDAYSGMVELTSFGNVDTEELNWNLHEYVTKSGWNELFLPIASANKQGGDIDLTQVDCIRIVGMVKDDRTMVMGIDELYMTNAKSPAIATATGELGNGNALVAGTAISTDKSTDGSMAEFYVEEGTGLGGTNSLTYYMYAATDAGYYQSVAVDLTQAGFATTKISRDQVLWFWVDADTSAEQTLQIAVNDAPMTINSNDNDSIYTIIKNAEGNPEIRSIAYGTTYNGLSLIDGETAGYAGLLLDKEWSGWIGIPVKHFYQDNTSVLNDNEALTKLTVQAFGMGAQEGDKVHFDSFWLTNNNAMPNLANSDLLYRGVRIHSAAPMIGKDISINFKMDAAIAQLGYSDIHAVVTLNGVETDIAGVLDATNNVYVFALTNIRPDWMNEEIAIDVYATFNGNEKKYESHTYTVAEYCYNMLEENYSEATQADELATLLVNMLNYGALSQVYTNHNTDYLATANLTATWSSWISTDYTPATPDTAKSNDLTDPTVDIVGVSLFLRENTRIRLRLTGEVTENMSLKVTDANGEVIATIAYENFVQSGSSWYVYIDGMTATQMRQVIKATVMSGEEAVSNTLTYSIRSYADKEIMKDATTDLAKLLKAMMLYGDAAVAYAAK